jgi:DNA ligase-1
MQRRDLLSRFSLGCFGCLTAAPSSASEAPALWLASPYQGHENLSDYWVSEKYDGIRGYWNGQQLLSRSGKVLTPPAWFVRAWPSTPFEGELWAGLGQFEQTAAIIQQKQASDSEWRALRFMVFDVSAHGKTFTERMALYQGLAKHIE